MSILVVDDNKVNLFVIEKILNKAGYSDTLLATSATDMYKQLEVNYNLHGQSTINLILLDIMMPGIDGIEACRKIQGIKQYKDIPVIFVTAIEDKHKLAEALDAGGTDYLMKPINQIELLARIRVALRLKYEKDWHNLQDEKISRELELATKVQRSHLSEPVINDQIRITTSYLPTFNLAGDMYYWHQIDKDRYAIILIDMMGHGISAALICMFVSSTLRDAIKNIVDPELVAQELNRCMTMLSEKTKLMSYYFTGIYLVVDTKQKKVDYINAGHPSGYALIDGKTTINLDSNTTAIGFFDNIQVVKSTFTYQESLQILLFTDGLVEFLNEDELVSLDYLRTLASEPWNPDLTSSPIDIILPNGLEKGHSDDMCAIMIQA